MIRTFQICHMGRHLYIRKERKLRCCQFLPLLATTRIHSSSNGGVRDFCRSSRAKEGMDHSVLVQLQFWEHVF